jgi:hypothetical protein
MDESTMITVGDAYRAMFEFVDAYWHRGSESDDQIASMLSSMQFGTVGPTETADPAQWQDWLDAVKKVA